MGPQVINFATPMYHVVPGDAYYFANLLDPNEAHISTPPKFVSGLYVLSLSNRAVLELHDFRNVQCARDMHIRFAAPVMPGDVLYTHGSYVVTERNDGLLEINSNCLVMRVDQAVLRYQITQLAGRGK